MATVDLCAKNELTHEAYVFEDDSYMGLGWTALPGEGGCDDFEALARADGYQWTTHPHKLECLALGLVLLSLLILGGFRRYQKLR